MDLQQDDWWETEWDAIQEGVVEMDTSGLDEMSASGMAFIKTSSRRNLFSKKITSNIYAKFISRFRNKRAVII